MSPSVTFSNTSLAQSSIVSNQWTVQQGQALIFSLMSHCQVQGFIPSICSKPSAIDAKDAKKKNVISTFLHSVNTLDSILEVYHFHIIIFLLEIKQKINDENKE